MWKSISKILLSLDIVMEKVMIDGGPGGTRTPEGGAIWFTARPV